MPVSFLTQPSLVFPFCICSLMTIMIFVGAALHVCSLHFIRRLIEELPPGASRNWWKLLSVFVLLFIVGYMGFYLMKQGGHYSKPEMLVPVIFFFGAVFVLLVCFLAFHTTQELKRIWVLEQENITDPMLGIFNRRCLDRRMNQELLRAKRHDIDLAMMLVDVDHFKKVNDNWGHQIGDQALKHLADVMVRTLRQTDVIARFGGEEFVVLLPHTSSQEAAHLAERLRNSIEFTPLNLVGKHGERQELRITVSIGVTWLQPDDTEVTQLIERVDQAMYQAKQGGRNRVVCSDGLARGTADEAG